MDTGRSYTERVAAAVGHAIVESGQTVQAVARGSAVPQSTLHNRLNGGRPFTVDELDRIARYLGTDVATLIAPKAAA